jgi:uncharacterized integral membrane protein
MVGGVSTPEPTPKRRDLTSKTVAALAVAILLIAFGLSNRDEVPIDWLVGTTDTPLIVVIVVSAVLGAVIGGLAVRRGSRKARGRSSDGPGSPV